MMNRAKLHTNAKTVTDHLTQGAVNELERFVNGVRLRANEIEAAVVDYGRPIAPLPHKANVDLDVVEGQGSEPTRCSVNAPVFAVEEGRSEVTLELTFVDSEAELYWVEVDDLHVL